jgi:acyl-CoA thioester hydrolase
MLTSHEIEIRVRYQETDAQGRVHHANYLTWFELGRVELMRAAGQSYRDLDAAGVFLVIAKAELKYHRGAVFDDLLTLRISTLRAQGARIDHRYEIFRGSELIAEGATTLACVDRSGRIARLPEWLRLA